MRYICIEYKAPYMAVTEANDSDLPPDRYEIRGITTIRKEAKKAGNAAHALVPKDWLGERVKVIRLTRGDEEPATVEESDAGRYIVHGYSFMDKETGPVGDGAHVYLPDDWRGDEVQIVRVTNTEADADA